MEQFRQLRFRRGASSKLRGVVLRDKLLPLGPIGGLVVPDGERAAGSMRRAVSRLAGVLYLEVLVNLGEGEVIASELFKSEFPQISRAEIN